MAIIYLNLVRKNMEEHIEAYDPTILAGLGLFLTLCMPVVFLAAILGEGLIPFGMTSVMFAPIVGLFVTPIGLLVLFITFILRKKHPHKVIKWSSAVLGSSAALGISSAVWFLIFGFGIG